MTRMFRPAAAVLAALLAMAAATAQEIVVGKTILSDDFDRFAEAADDLGVLPQGGQAWQERVPVVGGVPLTTAIQGSAGALRIGYSSGNNPHDTGVSVADFAIADAVISLSVGPSHMQDRTHQAFINYRASTPEAAAGGMEAGGYHVQLASDWSGSRDVLLRYGRETLAAGDVAATRSAGGVHRVKVAFVGERHFVWLDDRKVIDFWEFEPGRARAGGLGFGGYYSIGSFDNFSVAEAALGPGAARDLRAGGRIPPLVFQGRPLFVLGTFNPPGEEDLDEWLEAGGNTALFAVPGEDASPEERVETIARHAGWCSRHGVAAVYQPLLPLYSSDGDRSTITRAEEIPPKAAYLREMLAATADHPQTLGYYTFDEPENHVYKSYQDWDEKKDVGLAEWMVGGLKWTYEVLKEGDPDGYVMPVIAWWTTYEGLASLYDVNMANHYPTYGKDAPLSGSLYEVVHDAGLAADAVRAAERTSFVYMPGAFDNIMDPWRAPTVSELRYLCFAPLTQGAMGVFSWRLGRCSLPYRRTAVYPVMREVKRLIPWLLGEWCDEKVASDRDAATADYLKKLPRRVRTISGEEDAGAVEVDSVPDCSHLVRRRADNTYLLLAVSNRQEPLDVTFSLRDMGQLPEHALEALQYRRVPLKDGRIADTLEPFGVRAYIIRPQ